MPDEININVGYGNNNSFILKVKRTELLTHTLIYLKDMASIFFDGRKLQYIIFNGSLIDFHQCCDQTISDIVGINENNVSAYLIPRYDQIPRTNADDVWEYRLNDRASIAYAMLELNGTGAGTGTGSGVGTLDLSYEEARRFRDVAIVISDAEFDRYVVNNIDDDIDSDFSCLCGLIDDTMTLSELPCGHRFHTDCIHRHLTTINVYCPTCRHDVRS